MLARMILEFRQTEKVIHRVLKPENIDTEIVRRLLFVHKGRQRIPLGSRSLLPIAAQTSQMRNTRAAVR